MATDLDPLENKVCESTLGLMQLRLNVWEIALALCLGESQGEGTAPIVFSRGLFTT